MHLLLPGGKTKSLAKLPNLLWKPLLSAWIIFRAITSCKQMILQNLFLLPSVICTVWSIQVTADYINRLMKVGFFLNGIQYCFYHHSNSQLICANFSDLSNGWIFTVSPAKSQLFSLSSRIWQWAWFQNIQAWQFRQNHECCQTFVSSFLFCNIFFPMIKLQVWKGSAHYFLLQRLISYLTLNGPLLGILVQLSIYMHILNSFFSSLTYYSKLMFYYYFLPKICPEMLC